MNLSKRHFLITASVLASTALLSSCPSQKPVDVAELADLVQANGGEVSGRDLAGDHFCYGIAPWSLEYHESLDTGEDGSVGPVLVAKYACRISGGIWQKTLMDYGLDNEWEHMEYTFFDTSKWELVNEYSGSPLTMEVNELLGNVLPDFYDALSE